MRQRMSSVSGLIQLKGAGFTAAFFFFILGISAGIFTELMMTVSEKQRMAAYLDQYFLLKNPSDLAFSEIFLKSAGNNLSLLFIMMLAGLTAIGFPAALAALTYKGMALGFSAALVIDSMSFKGVAVILTSMIPQNLIIIPAVLLAGTAALNLAFRTLASRRSGMKKSLAESAGSYALINAALAAAMLTGCLIESFLSPLLTRLIL